MEGKFMLLHDCLKLFLIKFSTFKFFYFSMSDLFPQIMDIALSPRLFLNSSIHSGMLSRVSGSRNKMRFTINIKDKDSTYCILQIWRNQTSETLLTCSIPQLQSASCPLVCNVLPDEINSDSRLCNYDDTFYFSSNWLFTNLSMILVLPVPLSPRKMIL